MKNQEFLDKYEATLKDYAKNKQNILITKKKIDVAKNNVLLQFEGKTWIDPETMAAFPIGNAEQRAAVIDMKLSGLGLQENYLELELEHIALSAKVELLRVEAQFILTFDSQALMSSLLDTEKCKPTT